MCLKKTGLVGRIFFFFLILSFFLFLFFFFFCKYLVVLKLKKLWSQTEVFFNGQMVYYARKVLVRNILWKIIHFWSLFLTKFNALKFWRKSIWGEIQWGGGRIGIFWLFFKKKKGCPCTLGSVCGIQPNIFFLAWCHDFLNISCYYFPACCSRTLSGGGGDIHIDM